MVWDNRANQPTNEDGTFAYVCIDGTDFLIREPQPFSRGWYSYKFNHAGVRYIIATSLYSGEIMYVEGPFPCGHWSDLRIFRRNLRQNLMPAEMVVADRGYRGEPSCITPYDAFEPHVMYLMSVARARHEGVNGMYKQFRCLRDMYRHSLNKHSWIFKAVTVLVQLKLLDGRGSFQIIDFTAPAPRNGDVRRRRQQLSEDYFNNLILANDDSSIEKEDDSFEELQEEGDDNNSNETNTTVDSVNIAGSVNGTRRRVVKEGLVVQENPRLESYPPPNWKHYHSDTSDQPF